MNELDELIEKGNRYYNQENFEQAFACYKAAADLGSARGQALTGRCYYFGEGVYRDDRIAKNYFQCSAEQDDTFAYRMLGLMCWNGDYGFLAAKGKAFEFWEKGAKLGDPWCQYQIAGSYLNDEWGDGKSYRKAAYWYTAAYRNRYSNQKMINDCSRMLEQLERYVNVEAIENSIINSHPEYLNLT